MTTPEALHSSKSNEWFTPAKYIEAARTVLGAIDLDPASCAEANAIVRASRYYSVADDGLKQPWRGRCYLNPPYGRGGAERWSRRLIAEFEAGNVSSAILLVNAVTDCAWFHPALFPRFPVCFVRGRIAFIAGATGQPQKSPTHASAFVYLGPRVAHFAEVFAAFGTVVRRHEVR